MINKRFLASTMAIIMTFTTFTPAMAATSKEALDLKTQVQDYLTEQEQQNPDWKQLQAAGKSEETEVRIIVELKDQPVIDYAIRQGVTVAEMNEMVVEKVSDELQSEMDVVQKEMVKEQIEIEVHEEFVNVINGFSATTTIEDAKKIEEMPNVKRVMISNEYNRPEPAEPNMSTSNQMIHSEQVWDLSLKGTGMLVAVIDSSFDPTHPSMQTITDASKAAIQSASDLPEGLPGHFYNIKMPYAYNYYDHTDHLASTSDHGTHVAGTVAANGKVSEGGIKGVAPEAQVLGMKVFGDDPAISTTYDDIYIKAIEDAIIIGADAINMSLGSTAGFLQSEEEDPARAALRKASESGIITSISAGNSDRFGSGAGNPINSNPDTGVLGSPSVNPDSFSVASIENTHVMAPTLVTSDSAIGFQVSGDLDPVQVFAGEDKEYVYCGIGVESDFTGKVLEGKIALIQRGSIGFGVKVLNAQNAKAAGVIIFNSSAGGDALMGMSFGDQAPSIKIPAVFVGLTNGIALRDAASKTIRFSTDMISVVNPKGGIMSDFTSWGPTPNLDFKPEITAPGGNIYSTLQGGSYGLMSGTSMAAPHVAGGAALILERIDSEPGTFGNITGADRSKLAKNLIMSTAKPILVEASQAYVSPRQGGAGLMDLQAAATSKTIIVDPATGVSKVNLQQMNGKVATFELSVVNYGDKAISYDLSGTVQTDYSSEGEIYIYPTNLENAVIQYSQGGQGITSLDVAPGATVQFTVTVDTTNGTIEGVPFDSAYPNGGFVDGFVRLTDKADETTAIGIPYMGFRGDWTAAPIIDKSIYDQAQGEKGFYGPGYNGLYTEIPKKSPFLGATFEGKYVKDYISISPNGDNYYDYVGSYFTFLRNARNLEVKILDKNMNPVHTVSLDEFVRKNYFDGDTKNPKGKDFGVWDGKVNDKIVEGQYYYQIQSKVDYPNAEWQTQVYPIMVDITEPVVSKPVYNATEKTITVKATDNFKLKTLHLFVNDKLVNTLDGLDKNEFVFTLTEALADKAVIEVVASDFAFNMGVSGLTNQIIIDDKTAPEVDMPKPVSTDLVGTNEVLFEGTIKDPTGLKSLTFDGVDVPFKLDEVKAVYTFSQKLTFKDGPQGVKVVATDLAGNKKEYEKKFYVDGTLPSITLKTSLPEKVEYDVKSIKLTGVASDNYSGLKVLINGSLVANVAGKMDSKIPVTITKAFTDVVVPLAEGNNTITLQAIDGAGNKKVVSYQVYRMKQGEFISAITAKLTPEKNVSAENPLNISLSAKVDTYWKVSIMDPKKRVVETYRKRGMKFNETWKPNNSNKINGQYVVKVEYTQSGKTKTELFDFTVTNYPFNIKDVRVIEKNGFVTVETDITNFSREEQEPLMVIEVTDMNGAVVSMSTASLKGFKKEQKVTFASGFNIQNNGSYKVEVSIWTDWEKKDSLAAQFVKHFVID